MSAWKKKMTLLAFVFPKLQTPKTSLDKCQKSLVSEDRSTSKIENVLKHCWNLHHCTFFKSIDHCQVNSARKSLSYWHAKPCDCLLTHCLPRRSILFLVKAISGHQLRCNYLRNKKTFSEFFSAFLKFTLNFEFFEKKDHPQSFSIWGITDSENVVR